MITGKQRAYLRKMAHQLEPIFQIGKEGVTDASDEEKYRKIELPRK